jgi:hypothetical protein
MCSTSKLHETTALGLSQIERERIERIALNREKLDQCKVQLVAEELAVLASPKYEQLSKTRT